ncbi:S-layer homology domain-containing protein [Anoxybacterium hadale]|uniref:S-layer homology domain-containing protein n=1 Tax=Anoxybacterium hadale TaxID=3408580 RepID=UPI003B0078B7
MKKQWFMITRLLIVLMVLTCVSGTAFADTGTSFTLAQNPEHVTAGQKIEIIINGNNLKDLYAYEAILTFDPAIVELDKAESKLDGFLMPAKAENNKITVAFTKIGKKTGENGSIPLCTIAFKAKAEGDAAIKLTSVKALDPKLTAVVYGDGIKTFTDLTGYNWAKTQIEVLASKGIINGTSETTYSPGLNITRADFMCMLMRAMKLDNAIDSNFSDVPSTAYYYQAVGTAKKLGIAMGKGDNLFLPKEKISRQDMMVIIARAMKITGKKLDDSATDLSGFNDSSKVAPYAVNAAAQLVKAGIVTGNNGAINPEGTATRAETAVIMHRILNQ